MSFTDQVGYIKGQSVSSLLQLIDNVIDQLNISQKLGLLITADYFHATDCISKDFMLKALENLGLVEILLDGFLF